MKPTPTVWILATLAMGLSPAMLPAVDVSPSRDQGSAKKQYEKANEGPGFLSGIFGGANEDSTREKLDRVSGIHLEDFALELTLEPARISGQMPVDKFSVQVFFTIQNNHELIKTFTFPSAQKYDFVISDNQGRELIRWSKSREFSDAASTTIINPGEKIRFTEQIPLIVDGQKLAPGQYTVTAILKGYDEFRPSATLTVSP